MGSEMCIRDRGSCRNISGPLHLGNKNRDSSSFFRQELGGAGEWESRGDRLICCYLHNPWNEKQFTYTYVDRTLPSNWRGQVPAHMQSRYAASYGTYLTLNSVPLYNNLWQHTAISYHLMWQQDTVYILGTSNSKNAAWHKIPQFKDIRETVQVRSSFGLVY